MVFGCGIGDFIAIGSLAVTVWDGYKNAPGEYKEISGDVLRFTRAVQNVPPTWPDAQTQEHFQSVMTGCEELLRDLNEIIAQNLSLADPKAKGRKWDRLMWKEDLGTLRGRIGLNMGHLTYLNTCLSLIEMRNEKTERAEHNANLKSLMEKIGASAIDSSKKFEPQTITPPLSPRPDSAPVDSQWRPPATPPPRPAAPPPRPARAETVSNLRPTRTSVPQSHQGLLEAIDQENLALIRELVYDGHDVNHSYVNRNGETPLTFAAALGHTAIVRWFLTNHADFEQRNDFGFSPLAAAARVGKHHVVELLLGYGANTEAKDNAHQATVLQLAVENGTVAVEAIRLLLEAGADVNAIDSSGRSVGHYLEHIPAGGVRQQIICMLKDYGVSVPRQRHCTGATLPPQNDGYQNAPMSPPQNVDYDYIPVPDQFNWQMCLQPQNPAAGNRGDHWAPISYPVPDGYGLRVGINMGVFEF